jgi:hypothetical protein
MTRRLPLVLLPATLLALLIAVLLVASMRAPPLPPGVTPLEELAVERVVLDERGISLLVRAGPLTAVRIAQVQVDDAFWTFAQDPLGPLTRLSAGWLSIPYPWVYGEAHEVAIITARGAVFRHRVGLAVPTVLLADLPLLLLVGVVIGLLPLALAPAASSLLQRLGRGAGDFAFTLSIGLLAILLVDTTRAALAAAAEVTSVYRGAAIVWVGAAIVATALIVLARLLPAGREGAARARLAALRLGARNLCLGLAAGAAVALGVSPLALLLTVAGALHNVLASISFRRDLAAVPSPSGSVALLALAGVPAVAASVLAGQPQAYPWAPAALAVGTGALLQVVSGALRLLAGRWVFRERRMSAVAGVLTVGLALLAWL